LQASSVPVLSQSRHRSSLGLDTRAAEAGAIAVLLVDDSPPANVRERLESVVAHTIHAGGTIHVVPTDGMPGTGPVAAVLRR
jgi:stalled ribosome rescue protein Dom34